MRFNLQLLLGGDGFFSSKRSGVNYLKIAVKIECLVSPQVLPSLPEFHLNSDQMSQLYQIWKLWWIAPPSSHHLTFGYGQPPGLLFTLSQIVIEAHSSGQYFNFETQQTKSAQSVTLR